MPEVLATPTQINRRGFLVMGAAFTAAEILASPTTALATGPAVKQTKSFTDLLQGHNGDFNTGDIPPWSRDAYLPNVDGQVLNLLMAVDQHAGIDHSPAAYIRVQNAVPNNAASYVQDISAQTRELSYYLLLGKANTLDSLPAKKDPENPGVRLTIRRSTFGRPQDPLHSEPLLEQTTGKYVPLSLMFSSNGISRFQIALDLGDPIRARELAAKKQDVSPVLAADNSLVVFDNIRLYKLSLFKRDAETQRQYLLDQYNAA